MTDTARFMIVLGSLSEFATAIRLPGAGRGLSKQRPSKVFPAFFETLPQMNGKTVAITGASRGLGFVTALALAKKGAAVIMLNRPSVQAERACEEIADAATGPAPVLIQCDLLDFSSVRLAARSVRNACSDGLDVLCCNAGIMLQPDEASKDGFDITASTNVLSHFLLTKELLQTLEQAAQRTGGARVVSMSSGSGFGPPAFDSHCFAREGGKLGSGNRASYARYHQSKLANLLFTSALSEKLSTRGSAVQAVACTPGVCATDMFVHVHKQTRPDVPPDFSRVPSVDDGACAQLKCICDPAVKSGQLWGPRGIGGDLPVQLTLAPPTVLIDDASKTQLWACCERAVGEFEL